MLLSIEEAKKILNNPLMTEKEVEEILYACEKLSEILFENLVSNKTN